MVELVIACQTGVAQLHWHPLVVGIVAMTVFTLGYAPLLYLALKAQRLMLPAKLSNRFKRGG
jgi:hypothetical protein